MASFFMADSDDVIPAPTSLPEVGIHLSYIRRDIRAVGKQLEEGFKNLDDHFVSHAEYSPVAQAVAEHTEDIKNLNSFKDTLNGKLIGFGTAISATSAIVTFLISKFF